MEYFNAFLVFTFAVKEMANFLPATEPRRDMNLFSDYLRPLREFIAQFVRSSRRENAASKAAVAAIAAASSFSS